MSFNVTSATDVLIADTENVLMIHAINRSVDNDDLLLAAELVGTRLDVRPDEFRYFVEPTPGEANGFGDPTLGPLFLARAHSPELPGITDPIVVTATVTEAFSPISRVDLHYRAMYGTERNLPMVDDGSGDGCGRRRRDLHRHDSRGAGGERADDPLVYDRRGYAGADQPLSPLRQIRSIRRNTSGRFSPIHRVQSNLPVLHWFVSSRNAAMTRGGTRGSLYYDGEFYDNVQFDLHGQSTGGFPTQKKSMDVDFTADHRFRWSDDIPRMKDFNLLTNYADKSKLRNTLAYEQRRLIGDAYHLAFRCGCSTTVSSLRCTISSKTGMIAGWSEWDMDPEGALYKMYNSMDAATGEKKTRRDEGNADLQALVNGVRLSGQARTEFLFDNVNVAAMANYLAGFVITSSRDCCHKNYYAYRDTNGTEEWQYMAWDVDLSQGRNWGGFGLAYFDDTIYPDNALYMGQNNVLISALYATPGFREMYLRRVRTLIDEYVKPPGTPYDQLPLETRVDELVQWMAADAALDNQLHRATWGQTGFQSVRRGNRHSERRICRTATRVPLLHAGGARKQSASADFR